MNLENFKSKFDWKFYVTHHRIAKSIKNETRAWNHACKIGCKTSRDVFIKELSFAQFRTFMRKPNTKCISTVGGQKSFRNNGNEILMYVINLKNRIDKKIRMKNIKNDINVFEAYGETNEEVKLLYNKYLDDFKNKRITTTTYYGVERKCISKIGCMGLIYTTLKLYEKLNSMDVDYVFICEDDIILHKFYDDKYVSNNVLNNKCDFYYVGYNNYRSDICKHLKNKCYNIFLLPHNDKLSWFLNTQCVCMYTNHFAISY